MNIKDNFSYAQLNPIAGDFEGNATKIMSCWKKAEKENIKVLFLSPKALLGNNMEDVFSKFPYLKNEAHKWIKALSKYTDKTFLVLDTTFFKEEKNFSILINGMVKNYPNNSVVNIENTKFFITLGENKKFYDTEFDIGVNLDICPNKNINYFDKRTEIKNLAIKCNKPFLYINSVGANDNLIHCGGSILFDENGNIKSQLKMFDEDFAEINNSRERIENYLMQDFSTDKFSIDYSDSEMEYLYYATLLGIKDYFSKNNIKHAVLGLSGGLDSTVCAVLLADSIGKENVFGISMPSKISSKDSYNDAKILAENLKIHFEEIPIKSTYSLQTKLLDKLFKKINKKWNFRLEKSYTKDNIQARCRATYLWGISNEFESCIPIATSDKSETYMGYATINGDMTGGYSPISGITKTQLFSLAKWINKNRTEKNAIPESVILKKPGAELAINPKTGKALTAEEALMPYEFLDEVIWRIEKKQESFEQMLNSKFSYETKNNLDQNTKKEWLDKFFKRMNSAAYKWSITPPSGISTYPTINKAIYTQPITNKINYKILSSEDIENILNF